MSTPTTWNLSPLAKSDADPKLLERRQRATQAIEIFSQKWTENNQYLNDPAVLLEALNEYEELIRIHGVNGWEWYYFNLRSTQDQLDTELKAKSRTVDELVTKLYNQIQFFELSLAKIESSKQELFLNHQDLQPYHHFLKQIFNQQKYVLSDSEEKILNLVSQSARDSWISMTSTFLSKTQREIILENNDKKIVPFSEILSLTSSKHKKTRDSAAKQVHDIVAEYSDVATEELNAILQYKKITDELRGFDRPDQARHIGDGIDTEVVDALVDTVTKRFDISSNFYTLKAKLFNQPQLQYHERNVPYGDLDTNYPYSEAYNLVDTTLSQLDQEFGQIFRQFGQNGQFDVYPRPGKVSGAFCAHNLLTQPTYILLNHTEKLQDVLTLAHEMGHGIHNELARKSQNALNFGTSLATAEVASTFMEDFVIEQLLEDVDQDTQLAVIMMRLNDDISSIFRQIACYNFETQLHQDFRLKGYLSTEEIGQIFTKHMQAYMGPSVEQSSGSQNWWVYWSHIRNYFYVYSYASGLLISKSLQALVRQDASNIAKVKQFMSAGQSNSPANIFESIGVNISNQDFWHQGLNQIEQLVQKAEELAKHKKYS